MKRKFRHNSTRSFLVLRNYKGYKISVNKQQLNSQTILEALEKIDPNFPIIEETLREIMEDVMDVPKAKEILKRIKSGEIKYIIKEFPIPSPFSHTMLVFGEADIVMMKERRKKLKELHEAIMKKLNIKEEDLIRFVEFAQK